MPTVAINKPKPVAKNPFAMFFPKKVPIIDKPKIPKANISPGPNFNPKYASVVPDTIKINVLVRPPKTPDTRDTCKALFGSPFCAIVYPSRIDIAFAGVPGVLIKIAGIDPPYSAAE